MTNEASYVAQGTDNSLRPQQQDASVHQSGDAQNNRSKQSKSRPGTKMSVVNDPELCSNNMNNKGRVEPVKYRTSLCRHYHAHGHCPYTPKCLFAHGETELRTTYKNNSEGLTHIARLRQFQNKNATINGSPSHIGTAQMPLMTSLGPSTANIALSGQASATIQPTQVFGPQGAAPNLQFASFMSSPTGMSIDASSFPNGDVSGYTSNITASAPTQFLGSSQAPHTIIYPQQSSAGCAGSHQIAYTILPTNAQPGNVLPQPATQAVYLQLSTMPGTGQPIYYTTSPQ